MHERRKAEIAICVVLVLLKAGVDARIRSSVSMSLQKITTSMKSAGKNVQSKVDQIEAYLDTDEGSEQMETVSTSIEKMGEAVTSITSDNVLEIVSGALTMISAASALIPVAGPVISVLFSLVGTIFSAVAGGAGEDIGSIVRREIEKALNNYDDSQLRAEASGTMRVYRISHAYLAFKDGDTTMNEHEVAALLSQVPVYQGVAFLGMLAQKVKEKSTSDEPEQVQRAMEFTQLYVTLAVMRSSILWEMYALVRTAPNSDWTEKAIQRVFEVEEDHDKDFLTFLLEPDYSQAIFFSHFNPSQWPVTMAFMEKHGLSYQNLDRLSSGVHYLRPEKWPSWYMYMMGDIYGSMAGTETLNPQSKFYFDPVSAKDNIFYIRSSKWPEWYVYMKNDSAGNCRGWKGEPESAGQWKIVKFKDGKYMLSPQKWLKWFIYMNSERAGWIKGWEGDPGSQGHWYID